MVMIQERLPWFLMIMIHSGFQSPDDLGTTEVLSPDDHDTTAVTLVLMISIHRSFPGPDEHE